MKARLPQLLVALLLILSSFSTSLPMAASSPSGQEVLMSVLTYAHTYAYTYAHANAYAHAHTYAHTHADAYTHAYTDACAHARRRSQTRWLAI